MMPPRRTPPRFRTESPPLHKTPPGRARVVGSGTRRRRDPTPEELEAAQVYARLLLEGMRVFAAMMQAATLVDPVRAAAIARARKIRALAERPGTAAEGTAARRALARFLASNDLEPGDL